MKKRTFLLFFSLFAAYSAYASHPKLILISIDGLHPSYIEKAKKLGIAMPNLEYFIQEGSYADHVVGVVPTITYPAHTSLITGVEPKQHGITHNIKFEAANARQTNWYWFSKDIKTPTLWDRTKALGFKTANVDWPVSVGAPIDYNIVQYWTPSKQNSAALLQALSTPHLLESMEQHLGAYPAGDWSISGDSKRLKFAQMIIREHQPDFMTIYLASLDDVQHHLGSDSGETFATLGQLDTIIGKLMKTIKATYGNNVYIALVSDHGHAQVTKSININTALVNSGYIRLHKDNQLADWSVYSLSGEGFTEVHLRNKKDHSKVLQLLKDLASNPKNGIAKITEDTTAADFILFSKLNYAFRDNLTGPLIDDKVTYVSTHGYSPLEPKMYSCFYIIGPDISKGKNLGAMSLLDITPTLAKVLGLKMDDAEKQRSII